MEHTLLLLYCAIALFGCLFAWIEKAISFSYLYSQSAVLVHSAPTHLMLYMYILFTIIFNQYVKHT